MGFGEPFGDTKTARSYLYNASDMNAVRFALVFSVFPDVFPVRFRLDWSGHDGMSSSDERQNNAVEGSPTAVGFNRPIAHARETSVYILPSPSLRFPPHSTHLSAKACFSRPQNRNPDPRGALRQESHIPL